MVMSSERGEPPWRGACLARLFFSRRPIFASAVTGWPLLITALLSEAPSERLPARGLGARPGAALLAGPTRPPPCQGAPSKKQACRKTDHAGNPEKPTSYDMPEAEIAAPGAS